MFTKFGEDTAGGFRMQEGDVQSLGTLARCLVNETQPLLVALGQCVGYTVLYAEGYVVYALVALVEPLLDSTLGRCRLQKLKLNLAALQESGSYFLVFYYFNVVTLQAQHVLKVRQALFDALNGYAQMLNV